MEMEGLFLAYLFLDGNIPELADRQKHELSVDRLPMPPQFFLAREVDMYHVP